MNDDEKIMIHIVGKHKGEMEECKKCRKLTLPDNALRLMTLEDYIRWKKIIYEEALNNGR